jgi:hypothetical protein
MFRQTTLLKRLLALAAILFAAAVALPAGACTLSASVTTTLTSQSPAAVRAGAVPSLQSRGGLNCDPAVLTLLGGNYIQAKFTSVNGFKLLSGANAIPYTASADSAGTVPFTQLGTVDYMQNNLLNLLGLLGGSSADLPFFIKPASATLPPAGTYTERVKIKWTWYLCPGLGVGGLCVGTVDQGNATATIDLTLVVAAKNVTLTLSSTTTWDPANTTSNPKSLPGSRRRLSAAVANPDIVAVDAGTLSVVLPTPARMQVALDGDGASGTAAIAFTEGSPASGIAFRYGGPGDLSDDVQFSADNGASWGYVPVAGNAASQAAVTHLRIRPRLAMAKSSAFSLSVAYQVR